MEGFMNNIVLYQPEIAGNCGNIVRTCASINARLHLIHPLGFSLDEKSFKRAGMDYFLDCEIIEYNSLEEFYQKHPNQEIFYITRYAKKVYSDEDYSFFFKKDSKLLKKDKKECIQLSEKYEGLAIEVSGEQLLEAINHERERNESQSQTAQKESDDC